MINRATRVDPRRMEVWDYFLMALCVCLAIIATTASLGLYDVGFIYCALVLGGTFFSYGVSRLSIDHPFLKYDGAFYILACAIAIFFTHSLNFFVDEDYFTGNVLVAAIMIWFMILGSFTTWRDGTLLFQTVPSLALFALVGCWDIFSGAAALFFLYLLCFAALMARVNARNMIRLAASSGYSQFDRLYEGVWRWAAGPQWALGSAAAIICVSLLGAPVLKETLAPIAGRAKIFKPMPKRSDDNVLTQPDHSELKVGQGPRLLSEQMLFTLYSDQPYYLRQLESYNFTGTGWLPTSDSTLVDNRWLREMRKRKEITYQLDFAQPFQQVPIAGQFENAGPDRVLRAERGLLTVTDISTPVQVAARVADTSVVPTNAADVPYRLVDSVGATPKVKEFVKTATVGANTDYEKAQKLRDAISAAIVYNLKAAPVPVGKDPVEYTLFESHQGYCDLYATAMAVTAREAGIPSRYVVGFLPEAPAPSNVPGQNAYPVKQKDSHAWAELYFKDVGWIVFDATDGANSVEGEGRGKVNDYDVYRGLRNTLLMGGLIVLLVGAPFGMRWYKTRERRTGLRYEAGRLGTAYEAILTTAVGHPRRLSQTLAEFLAQAQPGLGPVYGAAAAVQRDLDQVFYSEAEPSVAQVDALRTQINALKVAARNAKVRPVKHPVGKLEP